MIKVRSKTLLIPEEEASIGSAGEGNSTVREFQIDRISGDGVDLANLIFRLNFRHEFRSDSDRADLEKIITDKAIILRWIINNHAMMYPGTLFIQIDAFDEGGACRWKSYQGVVYVEESIERVEVSKTTLSELEQLEKKFAKFKVSSDALSNIEETNKKITAAIEEVKANKEAVVQAKSGVDEAKKSVDLAKVAVESAKSSVNSAKESIEAIKAENEATRQEIISKHGEVKTFADEVKSANREVKILSDEVGRTAIGVQALSESAKTASQNASASADRASASEGKAKESETKVLEALKKAEGMGGGGGASMEAVKNYVDTKSDEVIKNVNINKRDISSAEAENIVERMELYGSEAAVRNYGISPNNVITAKGVFEIAEKILNRIRPLKSKNIKKYKDLAEYLGYPYDPGSALGRIRDGLLRNDWYGGINIGDYIEIGRMKFFVAGIDCQFYIDDGNAIRTDFKHVDFVCLNTELYLYIPDEEIEKYKTINAQGTFCNMNHILQERIMPTILEIFPANIIGHVSPKYIGKNSARESEYAKIWVPTEEELVGTDCLNEEEVAYVHQRQYPLFIQHPRLCVDENGYITANTKGNYMSIIKYGLAEKMEYTNSERYRLQIPIGFRVQSEK